MEEKVILLIKKGQVLLKKYFKNKYWATFIAFIIWMIFIDNDNIYRQFNRRIQISKLNNDIKYYKEQLKITNEEKKALNENPYYFEKFVREKYLLKKSNEDIFVFSNEK